MSLPPHLAPWSHAGVACLLADAPLPPELGLLASLPPAAGPAAAPVGNQAAAPVAPVARSAPVTSVVSPDPSRRPVSRPSTRPAPAAPRGEQPRGTHPELPAFVPLEHWPPLWRERLRATGKAPVLWTYLELGEDFYGTPNPQRRALFGRLLRDLGHKSGTHSFWPCALPAQPAKGGQAVLTPDAGLFWSGVRELGARALLVFGEAAFAAMGIAPLAPLRQVRRQGLLIMSLPPAEELVANPGRYAPMLSFVRTALQRFTRNTGPG